MRRVPGLGLACLILAAPARADEGMWTFDNPPTQRLQERYGFTPSREWLDKVRLAAVRFMAGGSGSFVSPDGLMLTNHHVGLGCIQNLSTAENDYVSDGFLAASRAQEKACPGYEVNVLMGIEDVTARVLGGVRPGMTDKEAGDVRKAAAAGVENDCARRTGLRCDLVSLYQGAEYALYTYKKYTDVRLVFAPEGQAAYFGGDADNFTYPRFNLDAAFFRAYEGGQPARSPSWLRWSRRGAKEGDLVFVPGNPGSTSRQETVAQLESERDLLLPEALAYYQRRLKVLRDYAAKGPENARRAAPTILGLENSFKALGGRLGALRDEAAMAAKRAEEEALRRRIAAVPALAGDAGRAFEDIAAARQRHDARLTEYRYGSFGWSRLLGLAGQLVRYVEERRKPNEQRLDEYIDAVLPSLENALFSPAPIYKDLEVATLTDQLEGAREALGADHPYVASVLGGRTPAEVAREAVEGTGLDQVAARRALVEGGPAAVAASRDPMVVLARRIDPFGRELRRYDEDQVKSVITRAGERIARARFALHGKTVAPDATFTLRLAYGTVKGYPAQGTQVPPFTTLHGLYGRAAGFSYREPWNLSPRFQAEKDELDLATPYNFVSTADIVGGNSGSPVIDREGELVGLVFDGNMESLALDYFYTDEKARAIAVDVRGLLESAEEVYGADGLVQELLRGR
ncbi:MAG TPA: S46 family peptidase [Vicinamibacteria bacterium]|nr:S46 family peptidase [Vicinamibacteria bacterium]